MRYDIHNFFSGHNCRHAKAPAYVWSWLIIVFIFQASFVSADFRTNFEATHPPILIDNGLAILENDKIERHIMKSVPGGHNLFVQDKEVATLIENLYSKLKLVLVKKDEQKNNALLAHLKKINDHLAHRKTRFLTGDTICCFDCELMWVSIVIFMRQKCYRLHIPIFRPRLQHIRVAGKYFSDFEIPVGSFWSHLMV